MNPLFRTDEDALGGLLAGMTPQEAGNLAGPGLNAAGGLLASMVQAAPGSLGRAWQDSHIRRMAQDALNKAAYFAGPHLSNRAEAVATAIPAITPKFGTEDAAQAGEAFKEGRVAKGAGLMGLGVAGGLLDAIPGEAAVKGLLKGVTKAAHYTPDLGMAIAPIKAFHGSPHDFDRFDLKKIGTGEGAQAYGHGLYFAENEGVARGYRNALAGMSQTPEARAKGLLDAHEFNGGDRASLVRVLERRLERGDAPDPAALRQMRDLLASGKALEPGRMYEVGIHADPERFLDWDKPLNEQAPVVREAAASQKLRLFPDVSGKQVHDALLSRLQFGPTGMGAGRAVDAKVAVADALREAGVPGIKYLDAGSRGAADGSRNYVTFSDDIVEILRKYGLAGLGLGLGGSAAAMQMPRQQ